ncbi:MAG: hypothetical protein IPM54_02275 [Polyangiaceae bacterium]|nr:hypothetical protein [Polyangiaceae bacterium]
MPRFSQKLPFLTSIVATLAFASSARAADEPTMPVINYDRKVTCYDLADGKSVRVQCDTDAKGKTVCLVAPNQMQGTGDPLERVQPCEHRTDADYSALSKRAKMVPAIAEAPPGYARSELGRAFQVKFDLLKRFYIGAGWAPTLQSNKGFEVPAGFPFARGHAELGIVLSVLSPRGRSRHDMHLLEGSASFADLEVRGTLFSYDYQHEHRRPAFWISTFFGEPEVHPFLPRMGWGFRLLSVLDRQPSYRNSLDMEFGEVHIAYNPWQSSDMYSNFRLEVGVDVGAHWSDRQTIKRENGNYFIGPTFAAKSRISLGKGGLHYLFSDLNVRRSTIVSGEYTGATVNRLTGSLAYEGVLIAINDQPVSLRLATEGRTQNDFMRDVRAVELRFLAGLRMSFGAPPRVFEPMPDFEDP